MAVLGDEAGAILGAVLGELDGMDGETLDAIGAAIQRHREKRHHHHHGGASMELHKPSWRGRELGPGVNAPGEGEIPLPLLAINQTGPGGTGVWNATAAGQVTFQGQLQKPFKGNRLVATSQRVGATATALLLGQMFMGVDLMQATIQSFDIEAYGAPTAFNTNLSLMQGPPGIIFSLLVGLGGSAPTGTDSITAAVSIRGHVVH